MSDRREIGGELSNEKHAHMENRLLQSTRQAMIRDETVKDRP